MEQFDVYLNPNKETNTLVPYLLDIQHDILKHTNTRIVIPLIINIPKIKTLNPQFTIENKLVTLSVLEMASLEKWELGTKVLSLKEHRTEIINAIDFLITGY